MKLHLFAAAIVTFSFALTGYSQSDMAAGYTALTYKSSGGVSMPYRLFIPANYDKHKRYPLVLWLHGSAGRGQDNQKQISGGNVFGASFYGGGAGQASFVLAPQCPEGKTWTSYDDDVAVTPELDLAIEILDKVAGEYSIDKKRLYVSGQSMGGLATWSLLEKYPDKFAAAVSLCGGGNPKNWPAKAKVAIWAFHGDSDKNVPTELETAMIEAVRKAGGDPKYTLYAGVGHDVWSRAFKEPGLADWLFAQKRK